VSNLAVRRRVLPRDTCDPAEHLPRPSTAALPTCLELTAQQHAVIVTTSATAGLRQPATMLETGVSHYIVPSWKMRPLRCGLSSEFLNHLLLSKKHAAFSALTLVVERKNDQHLVTTVVVTEASVLRVRMYGTLCYPTCVMTSATSSWSDCWNHFHLGVCWPRRMVTFRLSYCAWEMF